MANAGALKERFEGVFDETPARRVTGPLPAGMALPGGTFGTTLADVKSVVIHETDGWPPRNRKSEFISRYINPGTARGFRGIGPQFYVSSDGTIARLIGERQLTWHGEFLNKQSIGIENGHRDNRSAAVTSIGTEPWRPLAPGDEDVPGQKFYVLRHRFEEPHEVVFCWFPAATFAGPKGSSVAEPGMLFTEGQYRSLAALARYLAEKALVPRNFPLLPWATREDEFDGAAPRLRRIALADERFAPLLDRLRPLGFTEADFAAANAAAFRGHYHSAIAGAGSIASLPNFNYGPSSNKRLNRAWLNLFQEFRGLHGHGFAGAITDGMDDHTSCPGPLFDWHRFAREVWDWWWYPFDFNEAFTATSSTRRSYSASPAPGIDTPLIEYYFENTPSDGRPDPYAARTNPPFAPLLGAGLLGPASSPTTFRVDPGTSIYAMANGELVAARLMPAGPGISMSFVLVRHDVYHAPELIGCAPVIDSLLLLGVTPEPPPELRNGRIDYDAAPTTVYSLYMHLGGIDQMNFDAVAAGNPDWLNRLLIRKKECDLAIDATGALNPVLTAMGTADFTVPAPPVANRPNSIDQLRMDQDRLDTFLTALRRGDVAAAPIRTARDAFGPTPIRVILGDFLGRAGVIRVSPDVTMQGIGIEVFSPALIAPLRTPTNLYVSEWARDLNPTEDAMVRAIGGNPVLMKWWPTAAGDLRWDTRLLAPAKLPLNGQVYHYAPLDFLRWINDVTWTSEWPKYQMKNGTNLMPRPAKPRPRRVA